MAACIKQIDFESTDLQNTLVVDGVILAGDGPHTITLSTTGQLGKDTFPAVTDATVFLYDEAGFKFPYQHIGGGAYVIEIGVVNANTGKDYFIEILRGNKTYRSRPEQIPETKNIEGLSYRIEGDQFILEAENTNPDNGSLYLKWNLENIYSIGELICNPFISPKRCLHL